MSDKFDRFNAFVRDACNWCVNSQEDCQMFHDTHPQCPFICEFENAEMLCKKLDETEAYFEHLAEITPDDDYDFDAECKAIGELENELDQLQGYIICCSQEDLFCKYKYVVYGI